MAASSPIRRLVRLVWGDWQTHELWHQILKASLSCMIALIIAVMPAVIAVFGINTFLIPMTTVFAHPGQRLAKVIEALLLIIAGALVGLGWSILGLYLSQIAGEHSPAGSSCIRAFFVLMSALVHGFVRSTTPRLFVAVWLLLLASLSILMGNATEVSVEVFTSFMYPILTGSGVVLFVNCSLFPELSTSYLGMSTIETLYQTMEAVSTSTHWFITPGGDSDEARKQAAETRKTQSPEKKTWLTAFLSDFPNPFKTSNSEFPMAAPGLNLTTLASLTNKKTDLRSALIKCKSAQNEVNFEYSISPIPPSDLKPISKRLMSSLVQNVIMIIGACENKFILLKTPIDTELEEDTIPIIPIETGSPAPNAPNVLGQVLEEDEEIDHYDRVEEVKPLREIESASIDVLESILTRLREPVEDFEAAIKIATNLAISCIAYCFDVPKLPWGARRPKGIEIEEVDLRIDAFTDALARFDDCCTRELKLAAQGESGSTIDLMPRMEMFLVSSFILGLRQAAVHILSILRFSRELVDKRRNRHDRATIWAPHYADIKQWLSSAGEDDARVLPEGARKEARTGKTQTPASPTDSSQHSSSDDHLPWQKDDEENNLATEEKEKASRKKKPATKDLKLRLQGSTLTNECRQRAADALEWAQHSDDLAYAVKMAIAVFAVSWPSFITSWRPWYADVRGVWAPLQLVLIFEVSIGTSVFIFLVRLFGTIFGCVMGYASYEIARGNRAGIVAFLLLGVVPSVYIQVATKYVKAGMISITTISVVVLAALNQNGSAYENFYKRLSAFLIGSVVAILVEVLIFPVRARDRLVESLSAAVRQVQSMHSTMQVGIDSPHVPNFRSQKRHLRFQSARDKAQGALAAAETFLPFCLNEPRLKGSFKPMEPIYKEIIYVLHQIIDRLDNVIDLRKAYGSSILEDLNPYVYAYRRNVAAANTLMLFSVHEALTTWLPLPQFLPSTRLAQIRLVSRVREVLETKFIEGDDVPGAEAAAVPRTSLITQRRFLAWNANAAGVMEIIEYLEELVELTKLLVGVNAFRSGVLERPHYKDYVNQVKAAASGARGQATMPELGPSMSAPVPPSTPNVESESEVPPASETLHKVATTDAAVQKFRQIVKKRGSSATSRPAMPPEAPETAVASGSAVADDDEDDALPMSLRRVGSRLHRDSTVMRRRGFSTTSRQ